jgi:hypothetical protein
MVVPWTSREEVMPKVSMHGSEGTRDIVVRLGRDELVIRRRYEALSIANDVMIGLWFLIGTILFFDNATVYYGTWLFLFGSIEMLIRPTIRLARHIHLKRLRAGSYTSMDASDDY